MLMNPVFEGYSRLHANRCASRKSKARARGGIHHDNVPGKGGIPAIFPSQP
jgi:hypothetical protein